MAYRQYYLKSLDSNVPIGKYKDMKIKDVMSVDMPYIEWLISLENVRVDPSILKHLESLNWLSL